MTHLVNDKDFRASQKDFGSFIDELSSLVTEKDITIPELPNKDIVWLYMFLAFSKLIFKDISYLSRY